MSRLLRARLFREFILSEHSKRAGMPVIQLLGGKCRNSVETYKHANGILARDLKRHSLAEFKPPRFQSAARVGLNEASSGDTSGVSTVKLNKLLVSTSTSAPEASVALR